MSVKEVSLAIYTYLWAAYAASSKAIIRSVEKARSESVWLCKSTQKLCYNLCYASRDEWLWSAVYHVLRVRVSLLEAIWTNGSEQVKPLLSSPVSLLLIGSTEAKSSCFIINKNSMPLSNLLELYQLTRPSFLLCLILILSHLHSFDLTFFMPIVGLDIPINLLWFIGFELLHSFHAFLLPFA